ncbi:hypothetical protein [Streptomyces sp. SCL15-4]|uniref:hypothetical protein n=1 Tax=Streptomyces sp. SCL15-4 TaxID=2967221 RepID=UPI0029662E9F|nr:hypothetical protein [Streptomyces sp. SCL15-4]
MNHTPDPRIQQLAEARQQVTHGNTNGAVPQWAGLSKGAQRIMLGEAAAWLRAAIAAGIAPSAERPTDDHDAVLLDNYGQLWGEYQTSPPSHGDAILRLVWASEQCSSKAEMEAEGTQFRLIGWSE